MTMNRSLVRWCGRLVLAALLTLAISGCGGDSPTNPPAPAALTLSVGCNDGVITATVRNSGGAMAAPSRFIASCADGQCDTLLVSLAASDSLSCALSNIHGTVTVACEEWNLEATCDDCLSDYFASIVPSSDLSHLLPSPLGQQNYLLCTYAVYVSNLRAASVSFDMERTTEGLTLTHVYSNITGNVLASSPGILCPDITGSVSISSVTVVTHVQIGAGEDPVVTLGSSDATVTGFHVNVDGAFGFVVETVLGWFGDYFSGAIEAAVSNAISAYTGSDLSSVVIVDSDCAS